MTEFATRAVHAGLEPDPSYGSVVPAIHQSSTYVQPAPGQFVEDYDYSRAANPTRRALENALGELEGGARRRAFASGMAATHALLTAVCSAGDHVVIPDDLYGGTYRLVDKILARFGLAYDMVDQTDLEARARRAAAGDEARLGRDADQPDAQGDRPAGGDRGGRARRARRGRQHVRHAGPPAPARVRRGRGRALDDEVPRRPLGHGRRRGRSSPTRRCTRRSASPSSRSARCPARSTASSSTAGCGRCTCGWPRTPRTAWRSARSCRAAGRQRRALARLLRAWSASAIPRRCEIVAATKLFALAESLGGVESLIEVPQAMTHQSVEGSAAAVPAGSRAGELRDRGGGRPRRGPAPGDRRGHAGRRDRARRSRDSGGAPIQTGVRPTVDQGGADRGAPRRAAAPARSRCPPRTAERPRPQRSAAYTERPQAELPPLPPEHTAKVVEPVAGATAAAEAPPPAPRRRRQRRRSRAARPRAARDIELARPSTAGDGIRQATALPNGIALPPLEAPEPVRQMIEAGNVIARTPYIWGGGHGKWVDKGYDCSGLGLVRARRRRLPGGAAGVGPADVLGRAGSRQVGDDLRARRATCSWRWPASASTPPARARPARAGRTRCARPRDSSPATRRASSCLGRTPSGSSPRWGSVLARAGPARTGQGRA